MSGDEQRPFNPSGYSDLEFAKNNEQRCPCVLVIDCSGSMQGRQIGEVNDGLLRFASELRSDGLAAKRVDIALITFGSQVKLVHDFTSAQSFEPETLHASGGTPLGEALCQAVQLIEKRKQAMRSAGVLHYKPWLLVMTDGAPTDRDTSYWSTACQLVSSGVAANKFTYFPLVTEDGDKMTIRELSPSSEVIGLSSHKFSDFFLWLTGSLQAISRSQLGGKVALPAPVWTIDV